jgi:hypothetical protein
VSFLPRVIPAKAGIHGVNSSRNPDGSRIKLALEKSGVRDDIRKRPTSRSKIKKEVSVMVNASPKVNVGINGFGRIGKLIARQQAAAQYQNFRITSINEYGFTANFLRFINYITGQGV